jgi:hypothetical protein
MELQTIVQAAMNLGVIPVVALYLVYRLHEQNKSLTTMLDQREKDMARWVELVISDLLAKQQAKGKK